MNSSTNQLAQSLMDTGFAFHKAGRLTEAEYRYRQALDELPNEPKLLHLLGTVLAQQNRHADAVACLARAVALDGRIAAYHCNLGAAYRELGRFEDAARSLMRAVALDPGLVDAHANLGAVRHDQGRYKEAEACLRLALARDPHHAGALVSLGAVLRDQGRPGDAEAPLRKALAIDPTNGEAEWALATSLLVAGQLQEGWQALEARWRRPGLRPRRFSAPRWCGEPVVGQTILLHAEQGRGDTIQFARFVPQVKQLGAQTILQVQPELVSLLEGLVGADAVVPEDGRTPECDIQCPLVSLPGLLGTTLDSLPGPIPYLHADSARRSAWSERLEARSQPGQRRVGLVWAGTATHRNDRNRSIPPAQFEPLAGLDGIRLFALQAEPRRAELGDAPTLAAATEDLGGDLTDFSETAALLDALDLLITVDTAAAHLAGALGRPAWVLLPYAPDWRWLLHRPTSPWYPSLRLFRQPEPGDWPSVITSVTDALKTWRRDTGS